jgi:CheY-like chemotaxis protein
MSRKTRLILLAEDEDAHRFLFNKAVSHLPIDVRIIGVNDGVELMNYIKNDLNPLPVLVFLDINMPRKNGLECLKEIKELGRYSNIPLIVYTTSDEELDKLTAYENNASLYLIKDGDIRSLTRILLLLLTKKDALEQLSLQKTYTA